VNGAGGEGASSLRASCVRLSFLTVALLSLASCRIYAPEVLDCQIRCGVSGACPLDTTCREGFCRPFRATGQCLCARDDVRSCGGGPGVCAVTGTQRCGADHTWGECVGQVLPSEERCNGLDDDCDGKTDEDIANAPACERVLGVCAGATQRCEEGAFAACSDTRYGSRWEELESSCDGFDNDCDGLTDEGASVALPTPVVGAWWFGKTSSGFSLAEEVDGGVELAWLARDLTLDVTRRVEAGPQLQVAGAGDTLQLAWPDDGGVRLDAHARDGGQSSFFADVTRFALSPGALALVHADGGTELAPLDGGPATPLGPDDGGTLLFSELGSVLAWSGGVTRTRDGATLRTTRDDVYLALVENGGTLDGLLRQRPSTGSPVVVLDVLGAGVTGPLTSRAVGALTGLDATSRPGGGMVLTGTDSSGSFWLITANAARRVTVAGGVDAVQLAPTFEEVSAVAWARGPKLWVQRICP